jgi:hypothetical protein
LRQEFDKALFGAFLFCIGHTGNISVRCDLSQRAEDWNSGRERRVHARQGP